MLHHPNNYHADLPLATAQQLQIIRAGIPIRQRSPNDAPLRPVDPILSQLLDIISPIEGTAHETLRYVALCLFDHCRQAEPTHTALWLATTVMQRLITNQDDVFSHCLTWDADDHSDGVRKLNFAKAILLHFPDDAPQDSRDMCLPAFAIGLHHYGMLRTLDLPASQKECCQSTVDGAAQLLVALLNILPTAARIVTIMDFCSLYEDFFDPKTWACGPDYASSS